MKKKSIVISVVSAAVLIVSAVFLFRPKEGNVQFNTAQVEQKVVQVTVTATGYVQPVDKVDVGTQVSGVIERIFVDFNSQVKKGQLLAELDKSTLNEKLTQANASLLSAESDLTFAQQNFDRTKQLFDAKAATKAAYEEATNRLSQAKTSLSNAKANLHQAKVNLGYADIYSPIDGVVLNRAVEQGQTVAASFNTPTLFTIANDLKKMQVEADVDEADIGQVKIGQKVEFTVDAYPDLTFDGRVNQIRMQPTVTSNVVTYTVIVEAPNPDEKLFPGMTANITVITQNAKGLAVPAEALSFRPTPDVFKSLGMEKPGKKGKESKPDTDFPDKQRSVWVKTGEGIERKVVKVGLNDGVNAIIENGLTGNETVILSVAEEKTEKGEAPASNPFVPKRGGGGGRR